MAFVGMIVDEVQHLEAQMRQRADEIRQLVGALTGQLESTHWVGPDREQFHGDWTGMHVPALHNVIQGLEDAANRARANAQQQLDASNS